MESYIDIKSALHTRGINIDEKQYLFVLSCAIGEKPEVAYGMIYHTEDFKKAIESTEEDEYLASIKEDAKIRLEQQEEKQLYDLLQADLQAEIQAKAMQLENYQFTTGQVIQILQNLLHDRASDLESSSVKDIISLINTLAAQGALQSGDNFGSHFIHVHDKFNALCVCGREIDVFAGMDCICPHCRQVYRWVEEEHRFYPQVEKL